MEAWWIVEDWYIAGAIIHLSKWAVVFDNHMTPLVAIAEELPSGVTRQCFIVPLSQPNITDMHHVRRVPSDFKRNVRLRTQYVAVIGNPGIREVQKAEMISCVDSGFCCQISNVEFTFAK
jgi:hypothetical protein